MSESPPAIREVLAPDLAATGRLAAALAASARRGDIVTLSGGLGLGKTTFARAFIRARPGGADFAEVPSPTFTLVQVYDLPDCAVWHFDLYRLARAADAWELGIEEAFAEGISLIEWPERLGNLLPAAHLGVAFRSGATPTARQIYLTMHGDWPRRLAGLSAHV
jgi:tRNA threonylcarbamoyladenosine biosynthesis protein TsaE